MCLGSRGFFVCFLKSYSEGRSNDKQPEKMKGISDRKENENGY